VKPGVYVFVIYFDQGNRGAGGSLIADTSRARTLLRVAAEQKSTSEESGTDTTWLVALAAGVIAVAAVAVFLRRRRAG
jgi:LPXTG-motif cell wall-anchored protein